MSKDWVAWHQAYEDPASRLSQRLAIVTRLVREAMDAAAPGPIRVLSLCAGEARDLGGAAAGHARAADLHGVVVEYEAALAKRAEGALLEAGTDLAVRVGDAGDPRVWSEAVPVDLLLLAGIFGNISETDIEQTISQVPNMCEGGATVIWTRHRRAPDVTPQVRSWFERAGCIHLAFETPAGLDFAVGAERLPTRVPSAPTALPRQLFRFRDDLW